MTTDATRPAMTFREARDAGLLPPVLALALPQDSDAGTDPTERSFAAYLTAQERDQLDARAATAEQERDDALQDRDEARQTAKDLYGTLKTIERERDQALATARRYAKTGAEALMAHNAAEQERDEARNDAKQAAQLADFRQGVIDRHRHELGAAGDVLAVVRDAAERIDRALATYDTTPVEEANSWMHSMCGLVITLPDGEKPAGGWCEICRNDLGSDSWQPYDTAPGEEADAEAVQNLLDDSTRAFADADTSSERVEVIRDLLDGWYAAWPSTAVTDPHEGIAWQLASLISAAEARASAPSSVPPRRAQEEPVMVPLAGWGGGHSRVPARRAQEPGAWMNRRAVVSDALGRALTARGYDVPLLVRDRCAEAVLAAQDVARVDREARP